MPIIAPNIKLFTTVHSLPTHLEHKPIYALPYQNFDGMYIGNTDAQFLSIGISQWSNDDVSLKIMRYTGDKWSRQSEELPLHRVIDASLFLAKVLFDEQNNIVDLERNLFKNQNHSISLDQENISKEQKQYYELFLDKHTDLLKERFKALYLTLDRLYKENKF